MDKKKIPFALLSILIDFSDENHILSAGELMDHLAASYHLEIQRRAVYANIALLKEEGFDISDYEENGRGYYLKGRRLSATSFTRSEILLLCNAIHASHFIEEKESEEMISRLLTMLSVHERDKFHEQVYLPNAFKSGSENLLENIDLISNACHLHRQIAFCYLHYDGHKELIRNDHRYVVSPHYIVFHDERPYVIVTSSHPGISHYRIDRITNLIMLDDPCTPLGEKDRQEAYQYAEDRLFMFAGETLSVKYRCQTRIMNAMVDLFGRGMRTFYEDEDHFTMVIHTTKAGAVFLAQQYMDAIEVIEPKDIRDTVREALQKALAVYSRSI